MDINFRPVDYSKPLKNSGAELAIGWPLDLVAAKLEAGDKEALVAFIGQRYEERFLRPIRSLGSAPKNSQGYGFAIMALCSLLIESLQSYRYGLPTTNGREFDKLGRFDVPPAFRIPATDRRNGEQVFCDFFSHAPNQELFPGVDGLTYY